MKKLLAALMALVMLMAIAASAEENAFTFHNGVQFRMNMDQIKAVETGRYEYDNEHTHGPVDFAELEYEHTKVDGIRAEVKYLFVGNELVAIRVNYETRDIGYNQLKDNLTAKYGPAAAVNKALLANGIYTVDDDGRLERQSEAIVAGNVMIVLELDEDDIDVAFVDL
ncbi:MAG: hypothetical protein J6V14_05305, partial [Clostridia bacterium]|nr:hypothetical protein [Clostridia bacterium]